MNELTSKEIKLILKYRKKFKKIASRTQYKLGYIAAIIGIIISIVSIIGIIILPLFIYMAVTYHRIYKYYDYIISTTPLLPYGLNTRQTSHQVDTVPSPASASTATQPTSYSTPIITFSSNSSTSSSNTIIVDEADNTYSVPLSTVVETGYCLLSQGGRTYHTHVNCFKSWPIEYQTNFKGWRKIAISQATQLGYRKCNFCNEKDTSDNTLSFDGIDEWYAYKNEKPIKKFTITCIDEYADVYDYDIGTEITEGYDIEKDKETLEANYSTICYTPKNIRDFYNENIGSYKMFVLDSTQNDNGKVKLQIGIFEEL